jgi:3-deoxy-D-manno-octulosonate 8-phosphate phosphatase (KDO 8-P phosphatase)
MSATAVDIQLIVFDVDGVLTDGRFAYGREGKQTKSFGPDDADALRLLTAVAPIAFVSADHRGFPISKRRIDGDMGHELTLVSSDRRLSWMAARGPLEHVAYMGDSFTDIPILKQVGVGITTADALPGVRDAATYVTQRRGGDRAVAEACFYLLVEQFGRTEWAGIV